MTREEFMEKAWVIKWQEGGDSSWVGDTILATFNLYDDWFYIGHSLKVQGHYLNDFVSFEYSKVTAIDIDEYCIQIRMGRDRINVRYSL